ncbi:MAG TPA: hypothetical protein VF236_09865 [Gaiellaceae bacterium]
MRITYAVSWQEPDGVRHSGRLELGADALTLEGRSDGAAARRVLHYGDLAGFRLARSNGDRLQGRPTLILELVGEGPIKIASVAQPGIVGEVAERLAGLAGNREPVERVALVVPLRPGAKAEAEALLRAGPPFDPRALGLESHDVYVTDDEVVFVFEGVPSAFVERLAADQGIWDAAEAWKPLIEGRIRYADQAYAWTG